MMDDSQRAALVQLRELTNASDDEVAISVLTSVDWDVQRAAELIFGTASTSTGPTPSSPRRHTMQTFDIDDSMQGEAQPPARPRQPSSSFALNRPLWAFLAFPFHVLSSVFRFIFGVLRIPIPQLRFTSLNFYRPLQTRPSSRGGPDKWLRELEEETGAISIGHSTPPRGTTSSLLMDPSQSSLTSRSNHSGSFDDSRKYLPDFTISSYEDMLRTCQREAKVGCVILVSAEHDDVAEFKRSTLTDPTFVKTLQENEIIVWGGDVRDQEAWSAAEKLQATTYPFVAFLALQPRRSPASSSSSLASSRNTSPPSLTVLSRHQGKSVPSNAPTSAPTLVAHLEQQLLPRVRPYLGRIAAGQREREHERHLREEQDRAFQNTARRDKERIEAKIAAERAQLEAKRLAEEEARLAAQRHAREAEVARRKSTDRMAWRRWTRRAIVLSLPTETGPGSLRVAIRLPSGGRIVQSFVPTASLTSLYALVDSHFIPFELSASSDPVALPDQPSLAGSDNEQALEAHILTQQSTGGEDPEEYWGFRIASAYPRVEIPWKRGTELAEISQLRGGGQVVVELVNNTTGRRRSGENENVVQKGKGKEKEKESDIGNGAGNGNAHAVDEDDGYDTEDSE